MLTGTGVGVEKRDIGQRVQTVDYKMNKSRDLMCRTVIVVIILHCIHGIAIIRSEIFSPHIVKEATM